MVDRNNDEIRQILEEPPVPEKLSPESIKNALDMNEQKKKQKNTHFGNALKWCAGIAACGVLLSIGGYAAKNISDNYVSRSDVIKGSYTSSASDYDQVYKYMEKYIDETSLKWYEELEMYIEEEVASGIDDMMFDSKDKTYAVERDSESAYENGANEEAEASDEPTPDSTDETEISETYNQEAGVLEADIMQTDGTRIYSAQSDMEEPYVHVAETDGRVFTKSYTVCLYDYLPDTVRWGYITAMYLEGGRLIVVVDTSESTDNIYSNHTYVLIFEAGEELSFIGSYYQDGSYDDVRLMEDGTLYLISNYNWTDQLIDDEYEECIPAYFTGESECMAEPDDILLPGTSSSDKVEFDFSSTFTNIGSLNVFSDTPNEPIDFKSLAGFSGELYCSLSNIYLASECWNDKGRCTDFTRISINEGAITPVATVNAVGTVNDQFSMSEYNGFFRAAVSRTAYDGAFSYANDNAVYVFDMDMQQVGEIGGFGENETIKSASFQGELAYVVTFRQTDPLYAIDLSDPYSPVILDEYKINGYSSYMQSWSDDLLLGFGADADENGSRTGLKLVMFDNSDPENLTECGIMPIYAGDVLDSADNIEYSWIDSVAMYDRKALLISPEKNLIAVPFSGYVDSNMYISSNFYGYALYSYDNGIFRNIGIIRSRSEVTRVLYIGDTLFIAGTNEMIAVDLNTMTENDHIYF